MNHNNTTYFLENTAIKIELLINLIIFNVATIQNKLHLLQSFTDKNSYRLVDADEDFSNEDPIVNNLHLYFIYETGIIVNSNYMDVMDFIFTFNPHADYFGHSWYLK